MSYLLDTNVVSELRKEKRASPKVLAWYGSIDQTEVFLSVLTLGEIRRGVESIRRSDLQTARHLESWLKGLTQRHAMRILPISLEIADRWGRLCLTQLLPPIDGLLASTALCHDLSIVTRNVADVKRAGVHVINPFED